MQKLNPDINVVQQQQINNYNNAKITPGNGAVKSGIFWKRLTALATGNKPDSILNQSSYLSAHII